MRLVWLMILLSQCLVISVGHARPVTDSTSIDKDQSFILVKISGDDMGKFVTLSLVKWEEEKISTSLAEYFSIPSNGEYTLIKQSISGNFYPYDLETNNRLAQGRKMLIGKTLKGSLTRDGVMQYSYTLEKGTINYLGDITATKENKKQFSLIVDNQFAQAAEFLETHFPQLLSKYGVTESLLEATH